MKVILALTKEEGIDLIGAIDDKISYYEKELTRGPDYPSFPQCRRRLANYQAMRDRLGQKLVDILKKERSKNKGRNHED